MYSDILILTRILSLIAELEALVVAGATRGADANGATGALVVRQAGSEGIAVRHVLDAARRTVSGRLPEAVAVVPAVALRDVCVVEADHLEVPP